MSTALKTLKKNLSEAFYEKIKKVSVSYFIFVGILKLGNN